MPAVDSGPGGLTLLLPSAAGRRSSPAAKARFRRPVLMQAGQHPLEPGAAGGHGRWLVYPVCDRVDLHCDASGTVIRMHMLLR
jgi:hypothetical protein